METTHTSFEQLDDRAEEIEADIETARAQIEHYERLATEGLLPWVDADALVMEQTGELAELRAELEQINAQLAAMSREVG